MPQISKYRVNDRVLKKIYQLFFSVVDNEEILSELLSPTEKTMISKRITIIYLLLKGIEYDTISDVLKVSTSTIAKYKLFTDSSKYVVPTLTKIVKQDKFVQIIDEFFSSLMSPGTPGVNWKIAWQKKFEIERKKTEGI